MLIHHRLHSRQGLLLVCTPSIYRDHPLAHSEMSVPTRLLSQGSHIRPPTLPPSFLLPSLFTSSFSTTSPAAARRDGNPNRGVSALRRTGLRRRQTLSVKVEDLPKPVLDSKQRSQVDVDPNHGLWGFFNRDRYPFATPEYDNNHGRAWTVVELRAKDFEDLHKLWWVCVRERNRLATERHERKKADAGYGDWESEQREVVVGLACRHGSTSHLTQSRSNAPKGQSSTSLLSAGTLGKMLVCLPSAMPASTCTPPKARQRTTPRCNIWYVLQCISIAAWTDTLHRSSKSPRRPYQHNRRANCLYQTLKHKSCLSRPEHSKRRGSKANPLYLYYNQVYYDKLYNRITKEN